MAKWYMGSANREIRDNESLKQTDGLAQCSVFLVGMAEYKTLRIKAFICSSNEENVTVK